VSVPAGTAMKKRHPLPLDEQNGKEADHLSITIVDEVLLSLTGFKTLYIT